LRQELEAVALGQEKLGAVAVLVVVVLVAGQLAFGSAEVDALEDIDVVILVEVGDKGDFGAECLEGVGSKERRPSGRPSTVGCPVESYVAGYEDSRGAPPIPSG
jgi:hypothetical protein